MVFIRILLCLLAASPVLADAGFQAGVAKVDITPKTPIRLSGYGNRRAASEGTDPTPIGPTIAPAPVAGLTVSRLPPLASVPNKVPCPGSAMAAPEKPKAAMNAATLNKPVIGRIESRFITSLLLWKF